MSSTPDTSRVWTCLLCDDAITMDGRGVWFGITTGKECPKGDSRDRPNGPPYTGHYPHSDGGGDGMRHTYNDGLLSSTDPDAVTRWDAFAASQEQSKAAWAARLRRLWRRLRTRFGGAS